MPIQVLCSACKATFRVSDQFAGRTGPCPKCKAPITIPAAPIKSVTIHEPEAPVTTSLGTGRAPEAPLKRIDVVVSPLEWFGMGAGAVALLVAAVLARFACGPGQLPVWLLGLGALAVAWPCAGLGYAAMRDKELEPYSGSSLWLRTLACGAVYALLWAVHGMIPSDLTAEMWQWLFIGPIFFFVGALASLVSFDFDWGTGAMHYGFYVMVTALLRWLAGYPPV